MRRKGQGKPRGPERYRAYLEAEREAVALYQTLAQGERDPQRARTFQELAEAEIRHAALWAAKLGLDPAQLPKPKPRLRTRFLGWMARRFGTRRVIPFLLQEEYAEIRTYILDAEASSLVPEERDHARTLGHLTGLLTPQVAGGQERHHRIGGPGNVRAAVMGGNDGLVSNLSLITGMAGGTSDTSIVLLAGISGLLAGAFSMAAGEYVSVRAQRDVYEHQIELEQAELEAMPEEEQKELALIYQAKGLTPEEAARVAERIMQNPQIALDTKIREELGLSHQQLGSPRAAAVSSLVSFAAGAAIPLLPFLVATGSLALSWSIALSAVALLVVGGALAVFSNRNPLWGGARMLLIGGAAASVTYVIGTLVGRGLD